MFTGTYTAIVTPFRAGKVDEAALRNVIAFQIKGAVDGIVPVGTTGESPTLDYDEHISVIDASVRASAGKLKVLDIRFPKKFVKAFPGPQFGVEGTRKAVGIGAGQPPMCEPVHARTGPSWRSRLRRARGRRSKAGRPRDAPGRVRAPSR